MAQPPTLIDAPSGETQRHGSQQCVFTPPGGGSTQTLICEEISYRKGTNELRSNNEVGKPNKNAFVPTWGEGTMTVQLKTATTRITAGYTTAFLDTDGTTSIAVVVGEVGVEYRQNDVTKVPVKITEKVN